MPTTRFRAALAAACAAALAAPAAASAATFHVDPAGALPTIKSAVTAARATAEADTITIAPGVYAESVELLDAADAGLTIRGAGDGADPAAATIIRAGINRFNTFSAWHAVSLSGVRLEHAGVPESGRLRAAGANLYGDGSRIEDVTIDIETDEPQDKALDLRGAGLLVRDVHADAGGGLPAYAQDAVGLRIEDSTLRGAGGGVEDRSSDDASGITLTRVRVATAPGGEAAVRAQTRLTIDSSLITGGATGIDLRNGDVDGVELVLRGSTLDPGVPGTDTEPDRWGDPIAAITLGGGQGLVDSSIVFDALGSWDDVAGELRCEYSAVTPTVVARETDVSGAVACPAGAQGNVPVSAGLVGDDYVLAAGSAARDAGRPGALAAGASAIDLLGRPRIAPPAGCAGRTDMGAFESEAAPCPPASPAPPAPVPPAPAGTTTTDKTPPRLAALKLRRAKLRGTLSEGATLRVAVKRCKRKRCITVARRVHSLGAGPFTLALPAKARRRGRFAVAVTATDAAGNVARAALRFTRR